jgi:hypothetical protein
VQRSIRRAADDACSYLDLSTKAVQTSDLETIDSRLDHLDKVFSFNDVIINSSAYRRAFETYISSPSKIGTSSLEWAGSKGMS